MVGDRESRGVTNKSIYLIAGARGGELGVLRAREHPLVGKSTLSKSNKNFIKHFVILRSNKNMMN